MDGNKDSKVGIEGEKIPNPAKKTSYQKKKSKFRYPKDEEELRAKVGYQFDKVWKNGHKDRLQMNIWAIHLLDLKIQPKEFSLNKLTFDQVKVLGLKLKFEFNVFE